MTGRRYAPHSRDPGRRAAAITKYRDAAYNLEHGIGIFHEESDRFIQAQYEGLPSRYLWPRWLGLWSSKQDLGRRMDADDSESVARRERYLAFERGLAEQAKNELEDMESREALRDALGAVDRGHARASLGSSLRDWLCGGRYDLDDWPDRERQDRDPHLGDASDELERER